MKAQIKNAFDACGIIEGFMVSNPTQEETLEAWALLIRKKTCWHLQGFYGRGATKLIESGVISADGVINWEMVQILEEN